MLPVLQKTRIVCCCAFPRCADVLCVNAQEALAEKQRLAAEAEALRECLNTTSCGPALRGQQAAAAQQAALAQVRARPA